MASRISRRRFIQTTAGAAGAAAFAHTDWLLSAAQALPAPKSSGIDHIVVVTMENRSFDHMMGWVPGSEGVQAGLVYTDEAGVEHATHPLAPDFQGCGHPDPDHSYEGGRIQFNNGACDGFLLGDNDEYAIGYYTEADLQFFAGAARDWTICDQYFSSIMGPTFPNRIFSHSAQTDRIENSFELCSLPTIWDRLAERKDRVTPVEIVEQVERLDAQLQRSGRAETNQARERQIDRPESRAFRAPRLHVAERPSLRIRERRRIQVIGQRLCWRMRFANGGADAAMYRHAAVMKS